MFKYVVFTRITQPVADHGQGIFFGVRARPSVQLLFQRFYLQSAAVQQLLQAARRRNRRAGCCSALPRARRQPRG